MEDRVLVAAMMNRDPGGLDGAYRRYANRLYAYCVSMLRDPDAAADAVHDTFVIAGERVGQLRDPESLRAWLYAIARHECLRILRSRRRSAPLEEAGDVAAEPIDATAAVQAAQLRELVAAASASLSGPDREMIELSVRHGLSPAEVGAALGLASNHAHARMSRARASLRSALGALLVARGAPGDCVTMNDMVNGWDGQLTALLRKRLSRHIDGCATCVARQREQLEPAALLSAYAALPFLAAPAWLGSRVGSGAPATSDSAVRLRSDGFPVAPRSRGRRRLLVTAAVLVLLVTGSGVALARADRTDPPLTGASPSPRGSAAAAPIEEEGEIVAPSGEPSPPTSTPLFTAPATPSVTPPAPNPTGSIGGFVLVPFTVTASAFPSCVGSGVFSMRVAAQGNAQLASALVYWKGGTVTRRKPMTRTGTKASANVGGLVRAQVTWWVEAEASDGRTFATAPAVAVHPCPSSTSSLTS